MALILCPECLKQVSDQAPYCLNCGYPLGKKQKVPRFEECSFHVGSSSVDGEPPCYIEVVVKGPGYERIVQKETVHEGITGYMRNRKAQQQKIDELTREYSRKGWQLVRTTVEYDRINCPTFKREMLDGLAEFKKYQQSKSVEIKPEDMADFKKYQQSKSAEIKPEDMADFRKYQELKSKTAQ